ncbi:putative lysosomal acid lipase/cholesteryl ester hydrolase [Halotydeus destructor]|nr:putative lysosomal acid lipase/cholesteryl ester hydrolase [Halotydeus destructor]
MAACARTLLGSFRGRTLISALVTRTTRIENELGFALSRRGYDVWMGNFRGSTYSMSHEKYRKSSSKFWEFSEDEKILIDLPTMLDYVIKETEYASMGYVGHSFGSLSLLALLSRDNKYNEIIKPAILTAPAFYATDSTSPLIQLVQPLEKVLVDNPGPFLTSRGLIGQGLDLVSNLCIPPFLDELCALGWYLVDGYDSPNIDKYRLSAYIAHLPAGESTWSMTHLLSYAKYQYEVRMFDFLDDAKNMAAYGSTVPPEYRAQNITSPYLCTIRSSGTDDNFVQPGDYDMLHNKIGVVPILNTNGFQLTYDSKTLQRAIYDRDHEICEIIQSRGYGCEVHKVITRDGYILTLQRIVNPKITATGKPVFLQHGRLASGIIWVLQGPGSDLGDGSTDVPMENELGFALSRRGYDVWIGNVRGSTYSQEHVSLAVTSKEFWMYTNDEKALVDLPAMYDYVLSETKKGSIAYVGHSLGCAMVVSLLTTTTKYNELVKPVILAAPVWFLTNAKDQLKNILIEPIWPLFINNPGPFAQNKLVLGRSLYAISTLCFLPLFNVICAIGWFLADNYDLPNLDITRLPVYLSHLPGGESTWSFLQPYNSVANYYYQYRKFDFGDKEKNKAKYGTYEPPPYRVKNMTILLYHIGKTNGQLKYDTATWRRAQFDRRHEICDIIESRGYVCEVHKVTTSDGYILTLQRIVNPKRKTAGKPVLLQHGRLASGIIWVLQGPGGDLGDGSTRVPVENELGFALSRRGYDVWIGNIRGSTYSQEHISLSPSSQEFWMYTNDDKALLDLPAMLDYVLSETQKDSMSFVGHSLGSSNMISLLTTTAKYDEVVKPVILTAPVFYANNVIDALQTILVEPIWPLFINNPGPIAQNKSVLGRGVFVLSSLCFLPIFNLICSFGWFLGAGYDLPNLDITRLPVYLAHLPGGESTWSFIQPYNSVAPYWYQNRKFNFGDPERNMAVYGTYDPPEYMVENITSNNICTVRSGGQDDWYVQPRDYQVLKQRLQVTLLDEYIVPLTNFSHLDHQLAKTAGFAENLHILKLLNKYA